MAGRRQFLAGMAAMATAGLAGCSGGGDDDDGNDNSSGDDDDIGEGEIPGEITFEDDAGEHLEIEYAARFEEMEFADTMFVEGQAQNTAENLRLHVELAVEMDRYLKVERVSESIEPGDTWDFTIEVSDVDQERIDEYTLAVAYTEPPEEV